MKTLRELLSRVHKLEDLKLVIPKYSRSHWIRLFSNLHLNSLKLLQTNAPHEVLAEFLELHSHIEFIDITSPCDRKYGHRHCSLVDSTLPNLMDLSGPTSCIAEIPDHNPIQGITLTCPTIADEVYPFHFLTMNIRNVCDTLTRLTLSFNPANQDILRCISTCAPMLRELRLYESTHSNLVRNSHFVRTWPSYLTP